MDGRTATSHIGFHVNRTGLRVERGFLKCYSVRSGIYSSRQRLAIPLQLKCDWISVVRARTPVTAPVSTERITLSEGRYHDRQSNETNPTRNSNFHLPSVNRNWLKPREYSMIFRAPKSPATEPLIPIHRQHTAGDRYSTSFEHAHSSTFRRWRRLDHPDPSGQSRQPDDAGHNRPPRGGSACFDSLFDCARQLLPFPDFGLWNCYSNGLSSNCCGSKRDCACCDCSLFFQKGWRHRNRSVRSCGSRLDCISRLR